MSDAKSKSSPSVGQEAEKKVGADAISNEVDHTDILSDDIEVLLSNPHFSDVILVVNGEKIPANKALLAARSEYFRGLLYGGLKESGEADVILNQTNVFAFRILLRYLYTAKLTLSDYEEDQLLEILSVAHQYCLNDLQNAIADYLKINTEEMIVGCVRLPHISRDVLLKEVRESGLLKAETILNAMEKRNRMLKEEENKKQKQTLSTVK
uniref:BTB domain-containing protein n=1 Tax=Haemonchus contortus TaxID=6289 RepID=A0A7I4YUG8_HAECO